MVSDGKPRPYGIQLRRQMVSDGKPRPYGIQLKVNS